MDAALQNGVFPRTGALPVAARTRAIHDTMQCEHPEAAPVVKLGRAFEAANVTFIAPLFKRSIAVACVPGVFLRLAEQDVVLKT
jgi:hypothetical protein